MLIRLYLGYPGTKRTTHPLHVLVAVFESTNMATKLVKQSCISAFSDFDFQISCFQEDQPKNGSSYCYRCDQIRVSVRSLFTVAICTLRKMRGNGRMWTGYIKYIDVSSWLPLGCAWRPHARKEVTRIAARNRWRETFFCRVYCLSAFQNNSSFACMGI